MPSTVMLLIEHPSGVVYRHQAAGVLCWRPELEGVLAPVDFSDAEVAQIMKLREDGVGISSEVADAIDAILEANPRTRYLTVDRSSLDESTEAWVWVRAHTKSELPGRVSPDYLGSVFDFGEARAVLIWPNSD